MRALAAITAAFTAVVLLVLPAPSSASTVAQLRAREHRQVATLRRDRGTVRFFHRHRFLQSTTSGWRAFRFAVAEIGWTTRQLRRTRDYLDAQRSPVAGQPAWLVSAFMCIHRYEGSWTDSGAPYWGGLQFGWNEWQRFGGRYAPTADRATAMQQIAAGIAYWRVAGFNPWPNTARACGLL